MKRITIAAVGLCVLAASAAVAQTPEKQAVETTTKKTLPGVTLKSETQSVSGTVKEYEAGKSIKLSGPDDKSYSFDLSESARVDGKIVLGQMATVQYTKGTDGKETVTVLSEATANAVTAAEAPKMHSETVTKSTGPGETTKTKTETVVGVVKEYESGKSIKVTGPKTKVYTFDLTEMVALKTEVSVGERVKVTYTTSANGSKATTIVAHPEQDLTSDIMKKLWTLGSLLVVGIALSVGCQKDASTTTETTTTKEAPAPSGTPQTSTSTTTTTVDTVAPTPPGK